MADISGEIAAIENAVYGEEVRGAIKDALIKMNQVLEVITPVDYSTSAKTSLTINGLTITFQKIADLLVQVHCSGEITSLAAGATSAGTIPEAYRPKFRTFYEELISSRNASGTGGIIQLSVSTNGTVELYNYGTAVSSSMWARCSGIYPLVP